MNDLCEFCREALATDEHHVGQGALRQLTDPYPELKLRLCRECHDDLHDQKAKREMGLALLVRAGRGSLASVTELFYRVTARRFPEFRKVRKW